MTNKEALKIMQMDVDEWAEMLSENTDDLEQALNKSIEALKKMCKLEKAIFEIENGISVHKRSRDYEKVAGMMTALKILRRNLKD